ncbi:hypothetical protein D9M69_671930 [compost metagenome]
MHRARNPSQLSGLGLVVHRLPLFGQVAAQRRIVEDLTEAAIAGNRLILALHLLQLLRQALYREHRLRQVRHIEDRDPASLRSPRNGTGQNSGQHRGAQVPAPAKRPVT